jgi:hypothetical protein
MIDKRCDLFRVTYGPLQGHCSNRLASPFSHV